MKLEVKMGAIMTKKENNKLKTTFEKFMEAKTPAQRKKYEEGYRDFLLSEMILAAMEEDEISVRKLAKITGVSPTIVQNMRSGSQVSYNTNSLFKVLQGLGYNIILERNGITTPLEISLNNK